MKTTVVQSGAPAELLTWLEEVTQYERSVLSMTLVAGDASPRRYFRVWLDAENETARSLMAVMSPPTEKNEAFLAIRDLLEASGIKVPRLVRAELQAGFFLLEDFGDTLLLDALRLGEASQWYPQALHILNRQRLIDPQETMLPLYDEALLVQEMDLFPKWFLGDLLGFSASEIGQGHLQDVWTCLVENATAQPQVVVHRDFHSRNLMCLNDGELGVIDFQDAVIGPITYDLVSLFKDCYIVWSRDAQLAWLQKAYDNLSDQEGTQDVGFTGFVKWFDLMGLQRHIKVLGIFSRLCFRDKKPQYLDDLPTVLAYVEASLQVYRDQEPRLAGFADWFEADLMPRVVNQPWFKTE